MEKYIITKGTQRLKWGRRLLVFCAPICVVSIVSFLLLTGSNQVSIWLQQPLEVVQFERNKTLFGNGKLVSSHQQIIAAAENGLVEKVLVSRGMSISAGEDLLVLSNPNLVREVQERELNVKEVMSDIALRKSELDLEKLKLEMALSKAKAELDRQLLELDANRKLKEMGVLAEVKFQQYYLLSEQARLDAENLHRQLDVFNRSYHEQLAALDLKLQVAKERAQFLSQRLASLTIKAPISGVVKELSVNMGQSIAQGQGVLEVVATDPLFAEVLIPQYSARSLQLHDQASIKAPNASLTGEIVFIDSVVRDGALLVKVLVDNQNTTLSLDQSIEAELISSEKMNVASVAVPINYTDYDSWVVYEVEGKNIVKTQIRVLPNQDGQLELTPSPKSSQYVVLLPEKLAVDDIYSL